MATRFARFGCYCLVVLTTAAPATVQAEKRRDSGDAVSGWVMTDGGGPSIVTGEARKMTGAGAVLSLDFWRQRESRLSYPFNFTVSFNNLPTAIAEQGHEPRGETNFLLFAVNPTFALDRNGRWGLYVGAGAGFSWKDVVLLEPSSDCRSYYGCYAPSGSESSFQPAVDAEMRSTFRIHRDGAFELYLEARYLSMFTPREQFPGFETAGTGMFVPVVGMQFDFSRLRRKPNVSSH